MSHSDLPYKTKEMLILRRLLIILLAVFFISFIWVFAYFTSSELPAPKEVNTEVTDINQVLRTTITNLKQEGKLVVSSVDVQTVNSSLIKGILIQTKLTLIQRAKVQFVLDLAQLDPSWFKVVDHEITLTLPPDFLKTEIIPTASDEVWKGDLFASDSERQQLRDNNHRLGNEQINRQTTELKELIKSTAQNQLETLLALPIKATGQTYILKVVFNSK